MLSKYNKDMSSHRSQLLSSNDVNDAWIIVAVSRSHLKSISRSFPDHITKFRVFDEDVSDPSCAPIEVYEQCAMQLDRLIDALFRAEILS